MKQIISKSGWLVMAAALTMGMSLSTGLTSCSSDDDVAQTTPAKGVSTVHVCVNAGVGNGGTRSVWAQVPNSNKHILQFGEGDRLYVYRHITTFPMMYLAGFLTVDASSIQNTSDGTSATFDGELTVYEDRATQNPNNPGQWDSHFVESTYDFGDSDPLTGEMPAQATLVHYGAIESGNIHLDTETMQLSFNDQQISPSVEDLMLSLSQVEGVYNPSTGGFGLSLAGNNCIINCTVTDAPDATNASVTYYTVSYLAGADADHLSVQTTRTISKDQGRNLTIAFFGDIYKAYHQILIENETYGTVVIDLGARNNLVSGKQYNVTRSWLPDVTETSTGELVHPASVIERSYTFNSDANITVRGNVPDYDFNLNGNNNNIKFDGVNVQSSAATSPFSAWGSSNNINLELSGENRIVCTHENASAGITCQGNLKLSGNGTLILTNLMNTAYGLWAYNYNTANHDLDNALANLAADGYVVTRNGVHNADGTYTWTYTVAPKPLTVTNTNGVECTENKDESGGYHFLTNYIEVNVSGNATNQTITFDDCPVTLNISGLTVEQTQAKGSFIMVNCKDTYVDPLSTWIVLNGDNYITLSSQQNTWEGYGNALKCAGGLRITGDGTLTITTADPDNCGIIATNYTTKGSEAYTFPAGVELGYMSYYIVTRSARQNNGDGTYTWTYTVRPRN